MFNNISIINKHVRDLINILLKYYLNQTNST